MDNEGFDPNDNLSYHNIGAGIKPILAVMTSTAPVMP